MGLPRLPPPRAWPRSAWLLVAANLVPLAGVLLLRWDLGAVMVLFWAENAVVGVCHIARLALIARWAALFLVPFFTFHYGIFTLVHGMFVFLLFAQGADWRIVLPGIAALAVSHGASFVMNFLRGGELERLREKRGDVNALMAAPYKRVVVLHLTILGGGFLMMALGSPAYALALLVVLKTAMDLAAHVRERERGGAGRGKASPDANTQS